MASFEDALSIESMQKQRRLYGVPLSNENRYISDSDELYFKVMICDQTWKQKAYAATRRRTRDLGPHGDLQSPSPPPGALNELRDYTAVNCGRLPLVSMARPPAQYGIQFSYEFGGKPSSSSDMEMERASPGAPELWTALPPEAEAEAEADARLACGPQLSSLDSLDAGVETRDMEQSMCSSTPLRTRRAASPRKVVYALEQHRNSCAGKSDEEDGGVLSAFTTAFSSPKLSPRAMSPRQIVASFGAGVYNRITSGGSHSPLPLESSV